jgi:hypothetical protein
MGKLLLAVGLVVVDVEVILGVCAKNTAKKLL